MSIDLLNRGLKLSHLRFAAVLRQYGGISAAADAIGISQPAASRLASELEQLSGIAMYRRTGRGIELTSAGEKFALRSSRILREIAGAGQEIDELSKGIYGSVSLGSVTGPAIDFAIPALRQIRLSYPTISLRVDVAASDVLIPMVLDGELDFALCRLPHYADHRQFTQSIKMEEQVSFVVRPGHALARNAGVLPIDALLPYDWIMPKPGAILRTTVERKLSHAKIPLPQNILTTSSYLFTLALVRQSNAIAPIATSVARSFAADEGGTSGLVTLETNLPISVEPYSLICRAGAEFTPAASMVFGEIERSFQQI